MGPGFPDNFSPPVERAIGETQPHRVAPALWFCLSPVVKKGLVGSHFERGVKIRDRDKRHANWHNWHIRGQALGRNRNDSAATALARFMLFGPAVEAIQWLTQT